MKLSGMPVFAMAVLALSACREGGEGEQKAERFAGIAPEETVHFTGTEPFWAGTVSGDTLVYRTPENSTRQGAEGDRINVARFAGNSGLGLSGTWRGQGFDMTITPGACSDGMGDRSYPYVVTLRIADETRFGCGWTDRKPFTDGAGA